MTFIFNGLHFLIRKECPLNSSRITRSIMLFESFLLSDTLMWSINRDHSIQMRDYHNTLPWFVDNSMCNCYSATASTRSYTFYLFNGILKLCTPFQNLLRDQQKWKQADWKDNLITIYIYIEIEHNFIGFIITWSENCSFIIKPTLKIDIFWLILSYRLFKW